MTRDCVGFGDCATCYHSLRAQTKDSVLFLCGVNDRLQYRCRDCNKRSTAQFDDPRVKDRLCVSCYETSTKPEFYAHKNDTPKEVIEKC